MRKKYWRYDILLTPSKTLWEKYEELYKLIYRKNSYKNPVEKIGENMTVYYWYCLLDNSHEKPFQGKIMNELWGQYVSLIFPTKTPMGKIENMTHFCIDIASLKTFYEKPLWGKLIEGKEYNMMFEQVIIQEKTPPEPCNSQSHWIPIPWNMDVGMDLVSESAKWLQDYFGKMFISQYGDKTFWTIIYALIWPVSILTIQATLSLQIMVGDSMESHLITLWSHAYVILQNDKWK